MMQRMYLNDLADTTEIVLAGSRRRRRQEARRSVKAGGRISRVAAGTVRLGNAVKTAVTAQRAVDAPDRRLLIGGGILLVMLAFAFLRWPGLIAVPLAIVAGWTGIAMLVTAIRSASRRLRRAGWQHTEYASTPRQR